MATAAASVALRAAKEAVRNEIKKKLVTITVEERERQSALVLKKLFSNNRFKGSHRVSVYVSTEHEVATTPILEEIFKAGKECFIPKYDEKSQRMDMVKMYSLSEFANLPKTAWNIRQPSQDDHREEAMDSGGLDLILVPGLAFTKKGHRLGRGKGYYDIYLDRCLHDPHGRPYSIALAFTEQVLPSVPTDEHDIIVDEVLYPDN